MNEKKSLPIDTDLLRLLGFSPVTIITTVGKDGSTNAAPYGWVTIVGYAPPQILFSVNIRHDTYRNVSETKEFVVNIPSVNMLKEIWITQKPFPYGVNELEKANLAPLPSEKVKPSRIKECKAHIECKVIWTRIIGSACLVLGSIEVISLDEKLEKIGAKERAIALNRPIFFSYQKEGNRRKWVFGEIAKIHTLTEENGEVEIKTEIV